MKTMAISKFKAHALAVVGEVAKSREGVLITKRGKPVAQVLPCPPSAAEAVPGRLSHLLVYADDLVTPLGASEWDAAQ